GGTHSPSPCPDRALFRSGLAASELRDQLEQQRRRAELAEKRAAEAIHGRERLQQARAHAADLVASRLSGRKLTAPVAQFLDRHWRHHLTQAWLRDGAGTPRHHQRSEEHTSELQSREKLV